MGLFVFSLCVRGGCCCRLTLNAVHSAANPLRSAAADSIEGWKVYDAAGRLAGFGIDDSIMKSEWPTDRPSLAHIINGNCDYVYGGRQ